LVVPTLLGVKPHTACVSLFLLSILDAYWQWTGNLCVCMTWRYSIRILELEMGRFQAVVSFLAWLCAQGGCSHSDHRRFCGGLELYGTLFNRVSVQCHNIIIILSPSHFPCAPPSPWHSPLSALSCFTRLDRVRGGAVHCGRPAMCTLVLHYVLPAREGTRKVLSSVSVPVDSATGSLSRRKARWLAVHDARREVQFACVRACVYVSPRRQ
jgi:hypothetical protein